MNGIPLTARVSYRFYDRNGPNYTPLGDDNAAQLHTCPNYPIVSLAGYLYYIGSLMSRCWSLQAWMLSL